MLNQHGIFTMPLHKENVKHETFITLLTAAGFFEP